MSGDQQPEVGQPKTSLLAKDYKNFEEFASDMTSKYPNSSPEQLREMYGVHRLMHTLVSRPDALPALMRKNPDVNQAVRDYLKGDEEMRKYLDEATAAEKERILKGLEQTMDVWNSLVHSFYGYAPDTVNLMATSPGSYGERIAVMERAFAQLNKTAKERREATRVKVRDTISDLESVAYKLGVELPRESYALTLDENLAQAHDIAVNLLASISKKSWEEHQRIGSIFLSLLKEDDTEALRIFSVLLEKTNGHESVFKEKTGMPHEAIDGALKRLEEKGLIVHDDTHKHLYSAKRPFANVSGLPDTQAVYRTLIEKTYSAGLLNDDEKAALGKQTAVDGLPSLIELIDGSIKDYGKNVAEREQTLVQKEILLSERERSVAAREAAALQREKPAPKGKGKRKKK